MHNYSLLCDQVVLVVVEPSLSVRTALLKGFPDDFIVIVMENGQELLSYLKVGLLPSVLILADELGDVDVFSFCQSFKLNERVRDVPIIINFSETSGDDKIVKFLGVGVADYSFKSGNKAILIQKVRTQASLTRARWRNNQHLINERKSLDEIDVLRQEQRDLFFRFASAGEHSDRESFSHNLRVGQYAEVIASHVGMSEEFCKLIGVAAAGHDIGMLCVPYEIINKKGILTRFERDTMESHTVIGFDLLDNSKSSLLKMASEIAYAHHEKWDGTGYPNGLRNLEIPISARIVALADVFDALLTERFQREAWTIEAALKEVILAGFGKHFDPKLRAAFGSALGEIMKIYSKRSGS